MKYNEELMKDYAVKVMAKIMNGTDWRWESPNERVLEMLMRKLRLYPLEEIEEVIEKTNVPEELYEDAIKEIKGRSNITKNIGGYSCEI